MTNGDGRVMLRLEGLRKSFGDLVAVEGLSLDIHAGEIFGLLGPNGAGKTTTVNMCVGLTKPDDGTVTLNGGGDPTQPEVRRRLGVAPQALSLYDELNGEENLRFLSRLYALSGAKLAERVKWALDFVGLYDRRRDRVAGYSGGMKRRLNLAAALLHDPELLICDEPTVGVDPQSRNAILERIGAFKDMGRTVIYTSHYMEEVERICDRVGVMDRGRLLALDTVEGLLASHGGEKTVIAETREGEIRVSSADPLGELQRLAARGTLGSFRVERPSLETVFLNLTGRTLRE